MSGVWKSVKKIFKKVVKVVKKIAPYIILAAAVYFTAGAALGGIGALAGGTVAGGAASAGAAGAGAVFAGGAVAGTAAGGTGIVAALGGLSTGGLLTAAVSSGLVGQALAGAGQAYIGAKANEDERDFELNQQQDKTRRFNINDSSVFTANESPRPGSPIDQGFGTGLGTQVADLSGLDQPLLTNTGFQPTSSIGSAADTGPERPLVDDPRERQRKYRYNSETGTIDYA